MLKTVPVAPAVVAPLVPTEGTTAAVTAPSTFVAPPGPPVAAGAAVAPVAVATGGTAGRGRRRRRVGVGAKGARAVSPAAAVAVAEAEKAAEALRLAAEAERAAVLRRADQTHTLNIEWSRSLDNKVAPLLTVAGAISAVVLFLLNHATLLVNHEGTRTLLFLAFVPLFAVLVKCMETISPSLKLARWGQNRHKPDATQLPTSHIFFGQIARYPTDREFLDAAKTHYADPDYVLNDLLAQTYINARVVTEKAADIAVAVRWLAASVVVLIISLGIFLAGG